MSRIPGLGRDDLPAEQQHIYDEILGSRGRIAGPFRVLLHSPEVAGRAAHLGAFLRFESGIPDGLRELAILTSARENQCQYEWTAHDPLARRAGTRPEAIAAVRDGTAPAGLTGDEALVVAYVQELMRTKRVSDALYEQAVGRWGVKSLVELTALVAYYTMIAFPLNAFDVRPEEEGITPLLPE